MSTVEQTLFVRKASGLIKSWTQFDNFLYGFMAVNTVLGLYTFTYAPFIPHGSLFWSTIITTACIMLEVLVYAALMSVVPRAGGDYIWQTRSFSGPVGFTFSVCAWWFISCLWVPIISDVMRLFLLTPILRTLGWAGGAVWLTTSHGRFVQSIVVIVLISGYIACGMKAYALIQRWAFWIGMTGILVIGIVLLFASKAQFVTSLNQAAQDLYGVKGDVYAATLEAGGEGQPTSMFSGSWGATFALVPFMVFWLLYPNWGATLAGEIRGASHFRRNIWGMAGALIFACITGLLFVAVVSKTMGYQFFMASSNAYWSGTSPLDGEFMSPLAMGAWIVHNSVFQIVVLGAIAFMIVIWWATTFLSGTRIIFAAAFDRVLPEKVAAVSSNGTPWVALLLMGLPSVATSLLYSYTSWFPTFTLDAAAVIAVCFLVTSLAGALLPWRMKRAYEASPLTQWRIGPIPLVTVVGAGFAAFLTLVIVWWLKDAVYGVNNTKSLWYLIGQYVFALVIWIVAALVRRREGMSLEAVAQEIPYE